jgi:hypothetical protein
MRKHGSQAPHAAARHRSPSHPASAFPQQSAPSAHPATSGSDGCDRQPGETLFQPPWRKSVLINIRLQSADYDKGRKAGFVPSGKGRPATEPLVGGGAALPSTRSPAFGRGGGRPLGREPLLPALHWGSVLSAPPADRSVIAETLARADRQGRCGMAADRDDPGRAGPGRNPA